MEEASSHPQRSLILHALNGADVEPDLSIREARVGDRYLVCSDGLSDVVSPDTLLEALQLPDPHESADRLVELALRAGGPDNVTCIVADVIDVPYGDDAPIMDGAVGGNRQHREPGHDQPGVPGGHAQRRGRSRRTPRRCRRPGRAGAGCGSRSAWSRCSSSVAAGGYGLWRWTQAQYFVGADGDQVAVYRGVNASVGPLHLYSVVNTNPMRLDDLLQVPRRQVQDGIPADNRTEAEQIIARLLRQQKPLCPTPTPTPTPDAARPGRRPSRPAGPTTTGRPTPTSPANPSAHRGARRRGVPGTLTAAPRDRRPAERQAGAPPPGRRAGPARVRRAAGGRRGRRGRRDLQRHGQLGRAGPTAPASR